MHRLASLVIGITVVGCAGGGGGATFVYGPTPEPLSYQITERSVGLVETPQGNQRSVDTVRATVDIDIGEAGPRGHAATVTFRSLDIVSADITGTRRMNGADLAGKPMRATLTEAGEMLVSDVPSVPAELRSRFDVAGWLRDKMAPLPVDPSAESWSVSQSITVNTLLTMNTRFDGIGRFAGDTTWNGRSARLIVVEGQLVVDGSGSPPGAPGEIAVSAKGPSVRRYVWDPAAGVMLAATGMSNIQGTVAVLAMGVSVPASFTATLEIRLVN